MGHEREQSGISRRAVLTRAGAAGLALPVLAACGGGTPEAADDSPSATDPSAPPDPSPTPDEPATSETPTEPAPGLLTTGEVPVGGGVVLAGRRLVVTQPTRGEFKAFAAACTHRGCLVDRVSDTIDCPCHGSRFSIEDGSVVDGPAPAPLAEQRLVVRGDAIDLA